MAAEDVTQVRIEMLRRRWELTASPHVSLQLADLYRQAVRLPDAIAILEKGLEANPGSVSLRVALGRYRMEGGDPRGATVALREVVDRDPSHLVANKLLVKSYLLQGELQRARDRLDLYVLLNDSDPEIETLERSVTSGRPPAATATPAPAEPFALPAVTTTVDLASLEAPRPRPSAPAPIAVRGLWFASTAEPFAGLGPALGDPDDWSPLVREGIFHAPSGRHAPAVNGAPAAAAPPPTAVRPDVSPTLGRLYLDQGHLAEAEAIFSAVLAAEPEQSEARSGMFEIAARRALAARSAAAPTEPLTLATSALPPPSPASPATPPLVLAAPGPMPAPAPPVALPVAAAASSIAQRRIDALRGYLARLRRARDREEARS